MSTHTTVPLQATDRYKHELKVLAVQNELTLGQLIRYILNKQLGENLENAASFFVDVGDKSLQTETE